MMRSIRSACSLVFAGLLPVVGAMSACASEPDAADVTDAVTRTDAVDVAVESSVDAREAGPRFIDDDLVCPPLVLQRVVDGGAPVGTCVPGRSVSCRCANGGPGAQTCDTLGRSLGCWCLDRPVITLSEEASGEVLVYPGYSTALPPRLVAPLSGHRVMSQRPTLRWVLPDGVTRARVELCDDRPCMRRLQSVDVEGSAWRPPMPLRPGVVFWRVQGLTAGGTVMWTSATWEFGVRHRDTPTDTTGGPLRDFNGDGFDDAVLKVDDEITVLRGGNGGVHRVLQPYIRGAGSDEWNFQPVTVGDFDGDGLADLAARGWSNELVSPLISMMHGDRGCVVRAGGVIDAPVVLPEWTIGGDIDTLAAGDFNGDGFVDLILSGGGSSMSNLMLYPGGLRGVATAPSSVIGVIGAVSFGHSGDGVVLGDVDADGYADVAIGNDYMSRRDGQVHIFYGNPSGRLEGRVQTIPSPRAGGFGILMLGGDFDGDGFADMIGVAYFGGPFLYRGSRVGLDPTPTRIGPTDVGVGAVGDLNGDGLLDVVLNDRVYWRRSEGMLSTRPDIILRSLSERDGSVAIRGCPGDLDGDGIDDLLLGTITDLDTPGRLYLFAGAREGISVPSLMWSFPDPLGVRRIF